jgi:hypothetical protein
MPATTATAITRELRTIWPSPTRLSTRITADGTAEITTGIGGRLHADNIGRYLERATGRPWTFVKVTALRGSTGAVRITYALSADDEPTVAEQITEKIAGLATRPGGTVSLVDLALALPGIDVATFVQTLLVLDGARVVQLEAAPDQRSLTHLDCARAINVGGSRKHLVRLIDTTDAAPDPAPATPEPHLPRNAITEAARVAGTEKECDTYNCPKRAGHPDEHERTDLRLWKTPVTWTLACQMQFSRFLQHGYHATNDLRFQLILSSGRQPEVFAEYDRKADLEPGETERAIAAYADWLNAVLLVTEAQRVAKEHRDAPHYVSRPCGATQGDVTTSADAVRCTPCLNWIAAQGECAETRQATLGHCDQGLAQVYFGTDVGDGRKGTSGTMCCGHAAGAAKNGEVTILQTLINP